MTYQTKSNLEHNGKHYGPGDRVDMPEDMAIDLIKGGILVEVKEETPVIPEAKDALPEPEKQEVPRKQKKKRA